MIDQHSTAPDLDGPLSAEKANTILTIALAALTKRAGGSIEITDPEMVAAIELGPRLRCRLEDGMMRMWLPEEEAARE